MSGPDPQELEGERAPDGLPGGRSALLVAAMAALTVITAAIVLGVAPRQGEARVTESPHLASPPADPFSRPLADEQERATQRARRGQWEWSDRAAGRARQPLADAIDAYLAEPLR